MYRPCLYNPNIKETLAVIVSKFNTIPDAIISQSSTPVEDFVHRKA